MSVDFWSEKEKELQGKINFIKINGCGEYGCPYNENTRTGRFICDDCTDEIDIVEREIKLLRECRSVQDAEIKEVVKVLDDVLITNVDMCPKENEEKLLNLKKKLEGD